MNTIVYIDGLNFYYVRVRYTPYRWLDFGALCQRLLPGHNIARINYYTCNVRGRPDDPLAPFRQQMYLRALRTIPNLKVISGHRAPDSSEKETDVNLAVHVVRDGFNKSYDFPTIVTNDSDITEAFRVVRKELGYNIAWICPAKHANSRLIPFASSIIPVRSHVLRACQFPDALLDAKGEIRKPSEWMNPKPRSHHP